MRSIQKYCIILLALSLLFSLSACGKAEKLMDAVNAKEFSMGTVSGNHYKNNFVGIQIDLDDSWVISDEEDLAEKSGQVDDVLTDEKVKELVENSDSAFIFYAENLETYNSINIVVTNTDSYAVTLSDHNKTIDTIVEQYPEIFSSSGMEDVVCRAESFPFCGEDEYGIYISGTTADIPVFERQVLITEGTYSISITVCTYFEDTTADLLSFFSSYEGE